MAIERIEQTILRNLLYHEEYYRKVVPFLKADYFQEFHEKIIFEEIADFASKYDKIPTQEVLSINLQNRNDLTCLLYTSPSPRDYAASRMPSSA